MPRKIAANQRLCCCSLLALNERKQIGVDLICMRGRHAMRKTRIKLRRGIFEQLGGKRTSIREGHDLIVLAVHHQCRRIDLLEVLVKSVSEKALMQSY